MSEQTRRQFLAAASAVTVAGGTGWGRSARGPSEPASGEPAPVSGTLPMIAIGSAGRSVPRLGLGTAPLGRLDSADDAIRLLNHAFDRGIRYLDTAPSYSRGRAEERIGIALEGRRRDDFFIATKTLERGGENARRDIEQSLKRLRTDRVELLQVHALSTDADSLFGPDAVLATLEKMRLEKVIGDIGVTVHQDPSYAVEVVKRYPFATALVPVNIWDTKYLSFIRQFLPVAGEHKVAVIAMKVYADGRLLSGGKVTASECLRYALSQDQVTVAVPGCDKLSHIDEAHDAVIDFRPLSAEAQAELVTRSGEHKGTESEWYKRPAGG